MGQTPDQIRDDIAATRERMTETIRAVALKADVGRQMAKLARSRVGHADGSLDQALDRVASDAAMGDLEAGAAEAAREGPAPLEPGRGGIAPRRNGPLLAALACAAAGVLVGLGTLSHTHTSRARQATAASADSES